MLFVLALLIDFCSLLPPPQPTPARHVVQDESGAAMSVEEAQTILREDLAAGDSVASAAVDGADAASVPGALSNEYAGDTCVAGRKK